MHFVILAIAAIVIHASGVYCRLNSHVVPIVSNSCANDMNAFIQHRLSRTRLAMSVRVNGWFINADANWCQGVGSYNTRPVAFICTRQASLTPRVSSIAMGPYRCIVNTV
ncbi:hypothetical protein BDF19DRAFT_429776 [Syncephalis fuscata]|nr:hypothetical protein BDF19DRAFT_429776 [Syncephalis fuscata]